MYKMLFFLNKTDDNSVTERFNNLITMLNEIADEKINTGKVDNDLLNENDFTYCCELTAGSKEKLAEMMSSPAGKNLSRAIAAFHKHLTILSVDYGESI